MLNRFNKFTAILLSWTAFSVWPSLSHAQHSETALKLNVASEYWPNYTNQDGSGLYFELIKAVYEPIGIPVNISLVPFKRARHETIQHFYHVVIGTYSQKYRGDDLLLTPLYPINTEQVLAVFPIDSPLDWKTVFYHNQLGSESTTKYKAGMVLGYNYDKHLGMQKMEEVRHSSQGLKMLKLNRLDVYIDSGEEIKTLLNKDKELSNLKNEFRWEIILSRNTFLAFSNNQEGAHLCKLFDQRMPLLLKDGTVKKLFLKWGENFDAVHYPKPEQAKERDYCAPMFE